MQKKSIRGLSVYRKISERFWASLAAASVGYLPNAYYNYRKHRKADYYTQKSKVQAQIREIYHEAQWSGRIPKHDRLSGTQRLPLQSDNHP